MPASLNINPIIALAEWLFGPQHAFAAKVAVSMGSGFTAHMLSGALGTDRTDLVQFVLRDLVSVGVVIQTGVVFSIAPTASINKAIETVADTDLEAARTRLIDDREGISKACRRKRLPGTAS